VKSDVLVGDFLAKDNLGNSFY